MVNVYKTDEHVLASLDTYEDGAWIQMINPSERELKQVADCYELDIVDLSTALDEVESAN